MNAITRMIMIIIVIIIMALWQLQLTEPVIAVRGCIPFVFERVNKTAKNDY